jgi:hypothetical protein
MQRFNVGDPILILPKFAHLFPAHTGIVVSVKRTAIRPIFNDYAVKFVDGSVHNLFEFQMIEDGLNYQNFIASLMFDSARKLAPASLRGSDPTRHLLFRAPVLDIHLRISQVAGVPSLIGQVLEPNTVDFVQGADVSLLRDNNPIFTSRTDRSGEFKCKPVQVQPLTFLVIIRPKALRVMGSFSL